MPKIIDCFIFYNELDLLTYRLNILNDVVDYFVVVESTHTFVGKEKQLFFNQHKHLYQQFEPKIIHVIVDNMPHIHPNVNIANYDVWRNEGFQRDAISSGIRRISGITGDDVITVTDLDEIPDPRTLDKIKRGDIVVSFNSLEMDLYYYNLHTRTRTKWVSGKILSYKKYNEMNATCSQIRTTTMTCPAIPQGGWHLCYFGDEYFILNKIQNFSHQELNIPEYTDTEKIRERVSTHSDLYGRSSDLEKVEMCENGNLPIYYEKFLGKYYCM